MHAMRLALGLAALAAIGFVAGSATAADTIRLSLPGSTTAPTVNLKATADDLAADTLDARYGYGGYRGYGHGGYRGFGYGGYRGFGYGGYRGYGYGYRGFGYGYRGYGYGYRGYYGGYRGYYRPYYSSYYPSYSSYSYYPTYSYCYPMASSTIVTPVQPLVIQSTTSNYAQPAPSVMLPADEPSLLPSTPGNGTYPYNGGPRTPVPMPQADESATSYPRLTKPALVEDLVVTLPGKSTGKWTYPAYGETPTRR